MKELFHVWRGCEKFLGFRQSTFFHLLVSPKPSFNFVPEDVEEKVSSSPSKADLVYDRDVILKIADAPLSQVKPFNWNDILAEFPCLERKVSPNQDYKHNLGSNLGKVI